MPSKHRDRGNRKRRGRRTLLKIRAIPLVRMPKSKFFEFIRQAARTGIVPPEIELTTLNWDHATGKRYLPGTMLDATDIELLEQTYGMAAGTSKSDVRVEVPDR